jgi:hypothetical protein
VAGYHQRTKVQQMPLQSQIKRERMQALVWPHRQEGEEAAARRSGGGSGGGCSAEALRHRTVIAGEGLVCRQAQAQAQAQALLSGRQSIRLCRMSASAGGGQCDAV